MARMRIVGSGLLALAVVAGCSEEDPTTVGAGVVDPGFRTYEVVLEAGEFLTADTTFDNIGSIHDAPFVMVARDFEDELTARTLFRVNTPAQVNWQDTVGNTLSDTAFTVVGGTVTVIVDSLRESTDPVVFELLEVTESWDPGSVSWEQRYDTAGASAQWTEPGGTTGRLLATATLSGGDTLTMPLDSATASIFTDSAAANRGALIRTPTAGSRLRIQTLGFEYDVRPETADTVVTTGSARTPSFIVTPEAPASPPTELRVGGVPTWRSALQFRPLGDILIPCGPEPTDCRIRLSDVTVNLASLLIMPVPVGARRVERPFRVEGRAVLRAPGVPLSRSALTGPFGRMTDAIEPGRFASGSTADDRPAVPVTTYVRQNIDPGEDNDQILWIALLATDERAAPVFGYGAFGSLKSPVPPRLRLVVTAPITEASP